MGAHLGGTNLCAHKLVPSPAAAVVAMSEAQKALDAAIARRNKIAELLIPARAAVEADKEANQGIRGAPTVARRNKTHGLKAAVSRLESGLLPGEHREVQARPPGFLAARFKETVDVECVEIDPVVVRAARDVLRCDMQVEAEATAADDAGGKEAPRSRPRAAEEASADSRRASTAGWGRRTRASRSAAERHLRSAGPRRRARPASPRRAATS